MTTNRTLLRFALFATLAVGAISPSIAVEVGQVTPSAQRIPLSEVRHNAYSRLLDQYVDRQGLVDYRRWKANAVDRKQLGDYLKHLSRAAFSAESTREMKLAFWINAYNGVTIEGILREYPTSSIRNHTARLFGYNIWDDLKLPVEGKLYSLNQIEHEILRKLNEPRIHFAIVCASQGCPKLNNQAYVPERIDQQLAAAAEQFFGDPKKFRYNLDQRRVSVSPILDWFAEDFGPTTATQMRRIAPWAPSGAQDLLRSGRAELDYLDYDWSLNDQAAKQQAKP